MQCYTRHEETEHTYLAAWVESRGRMAAAERDGVFVRGCRQGTVWLPSMASHIFAAGSPHDGR